MSSFELGGGFEKAKMIAFPLSQPELEQRSPLSMPEALSSHAPSGLVSYPAIDVVSSLDINNASRPESPSPVEVDTQGSLDHGPIQNLSIDNVCDEVLKDSLMEIYE